MKKPILFLLCFLMCLSAWGEEYKANLKASQVVEYILKADNMGLEIERRTYNTYWGNDEKTYILFSDLKYLFDNIKHLKIVH